MAIFITGASGFVGLNLVEHLLGQGRTVVAFSEGPLPAAALGAFAALPGTLREVRGDVLDDTALEESLAEAGPEMVVHGAALTPGPAQEPLVFRRTLAVNTLGTVAVLEAAARAGIQRVLHLSSASVFGANGNAAPLLGEELPDPKPESAYAIAKYAGERAALRLGALHGLSVTVARLGAVFGPWEYGTGVRETLSPMLGITLRALRGEPVVIPEPDRRDWVYARDVAEALAALATQQRLRHDLYHVGAGQSWSVADWCAALAEERPDFRWKIAGPGETPNVAVYASTRRAPLDTQRLHEDTGVRARYGMRASLDDYLAWFEGGGLRLFQD